MTADIVTDALTMAWFRKRPAPGLIHHSDQGSQYASHAFQAKLGDYGMQCSMIGLLRRFVEQSWRNAITQIFVKPEGVKMMQLIAHVMAFLGLAIPFVAFFYFANRRDKRNQIAAKKGQTH